jgi:hypothetical protein
MTPDGLKQIFAVWLTCVANPNVFAAVKLNKKGEVTAIAKRTGLTEAAVLSLLVAAASNDHAVNDGDSLLAETA